MEKVIGKILMWIFLATFLTVFFLEPMTTFCFRNLPRGMHHTEVHRIAWWSLWCFFAGAIPLAKVFIKFNLGLNNRVQILEDKMQLSVTEKEIEPVKKKAAEAKPRKRAQVKEETKNAPSANESSTSQRQNSGKAQPNRSGRPKRSTSPNKEQAPLFSQQFTVIDGVKHYRL